ncbi:MAG: hypothetical protein Fur007_14630 [Rhodoferax sp.]
MPVAADAKARAAVARTGGGAGKSALTQEEARTEVLHRLRRAEGQIRGVQRMIEEGESCLKISQQFSAVRKALDSTYLHMTLCYVEQELTNTLRPDAQQQDGLDSVLKEMENLLTRLG